MNGTTDWWQTEEPTMISTARDNRGKVWVWAFCAVDLARQHIDVPCDVLGGDSQPDLDALEKVVRDVND